MSSNMQKIVFALILLATITAARAEPTVLFSAPEVEVTAGQTFTLELQIAGFPTTEGGGVTVRYNPKVLQVRDVTIDTGIWTFGSRVDEIDNRRGRVSDILFTSYSGVTGAAPVATIEFEAIKKGRSRVRLKESELNRFAGNGEIIPVTFEKTVVKVKRDPATRSRGKHPRKREQHN